MRRILVPAALVVIALVSSMAGAQTLESGQVSGTVRDHEGAPVPGATVSLSNAATGLSRTVVTNESGGYQFSQAPPGDYEILVSLDGFASSQLTGVRITVGSALTVNATITPLELSEAITVTSEAAPIDITTSGVSQLISDEAIENLPLLGRDFRDLARLSPAAQVTPGLRGGLRLGGQQSDYSALSIDGGDGRDNFFGEFFGSLETKNSVIPIEAVQEFQVVTNGFAPEFGRSTGGLLNVVTKSGTNELQGSAHWYYRGKSLTADDWLGTPSNIDSQNQIGAAIGGPIVQDKHFFMLAFDVSQRDGPLVTKFARDVSGVPATEWGIDDLGDLEGAHTQSQDLFSFLAKWDFQAGESDHISVRSFYTNNDTNGFTGGRGQNEIQASFGNTEQFENGGHNTVATWNHVGSSGRWFNEMKAMYSDQDRPRNANSNIPEIVIGDTGNFGQRFFLPIQGDNEKITFQDNFQVFFGDHNLKFGADYNEYSIRNNRFFGWSAGSYNFFTLEAFEAGQPFGFIQGMGLGEPYAEAALQPERSKQIGIGIYAQDQWQATDNLTITYGLRWDGTDNPDPISPIAGERLRIGVGNPGRFGRPPQEPPSDNDQWGPRLGAAYAFDLAGKSAVLRANWGIYYAPIPTIFMNRGSGNTTVIFCFFDPTCLPPGGYPNLFPDQIDPNDPLVPQPPFDTNYDDPAMRNPQVTNTTVALEWNLTDKYTLTATGAWSDSKYLRTGGFSSTAWGRNWEVNGRDEFGRSILTGNRIDTTVNESFAHGSFSKGEYRQFSINLSRRFADRYQFFVNYAWSSNKDNAASERDTDTFFGPSDPVYINQDFGRNGLDIPHQLKVAGTVDVGSGWMVSGLAIARSGQPYPAYQLADTNGDGVFNSGFSNDRPVVRDSFLLERYPERQPSFFQLDMRVSKTLDFSGGSTLEFIADIFNVFNTDNKYSNPNIHAVVGSSLASRPEAGDPLPGGGTYRKLDQIAPGSTPFAIQLGVRYRF